MVEAQEQMSDLSWAMSVIRNEKEIERGFKNGTVCAERERETFLISRSPEGGLDIDSVEHAEWLIKQIEKNGVTASIRKSANEFLKLIEPLYGNSWD